MINYYLFLEYGFLNINNLYIYIFIFFIFTETKETVMVYSKKNAFTNGGFRDTEDSHFFFYFGIMTVLSMMFYLALYNKKKVSKDILNYIL